MLKCVIIIFFKCEATNNNDMNVPLLPPKKLCLTSLDEYVNSTIGYCCWKNTDSIFLGVNHNITQLFDNKFKTPQAFIGLSEYDIHEDDQYINTFLTHDKIALKGRSWCGLEITNWGSDFGQIICFTIKVPLYNESNEIIGLFAQSIPLENKNLSNTLQLLNTTYYKGHSPKKSDLIYELNDMDSSLSPRENQVLFYTVHGKTAKEIAGILSLSSRTVESYIDNIKMKLNCVNKAELIAKVVETGLLNRIPKDIF